MAFSAQASESLPAVKGVVSSGESFADTRSEPEGKSLSLMQFVRLHVPDADVVGSGKLEVFIWSVYNAFLYAPQGRFRPGDPHALRFDYMRAFSNEELVHASIDQMRRFQHVDELRLAAWYNTLYKVTPNISKGDSLVTVATKNGETLVYHASKGEQKYVRIGVIRDPTFTHYFFNIWLGESVEYPELRDALLSNAL